MEKSQLLQRIHQLEEEIQILKEELEPRKKQNMFAHHIQRSLGFAASHWALFSLLAAIFTAVYVNINYQVDYFEEYRNISTNRKLTDFYTQMGNKMLYKNEWQAAQEAFSRALEINPNNIDATLGLVKAGIFLPQEGLQYYIPEIGITKLDHLLEGFPDDHQLYYLKGIHYWQTGNNDKAKEWFQQSIDKNYNFADAYIQLGVINLLESDVESAVSNFATAQKIDPDHGRANNNLGYMQLIQMDLPGAINHLTKAWDISPSFLTALNIGEAHLFSGNFPAALAVHKYALNIISQPDIENERFFTGQYFYNFMPLRLGDNETIKKVVQVTSTNQKQSILHYFLSFDYALNNDFDAANEHFDIGFNLDQGALYAEFVIYRMRSIENLLLMDEGVRDWFINHRARLESG